MLASKPDCEKRQMSAAVMPEAGRTSGMGLPPRLQALVEVLKRPRAATLRSNETEELSMPALVGSTTMMFWPVEVGEAVVRVMTVSEVPRATTTRLTVLESVPPGFWIWMETLPICATSVLLMGAEQLFAELQVVTRAVPLRRSVEPGPGLDGMKPLPSTVRVKPSALPTYTLAGCRERIFVPVEMLTLAVPDCVESSWLRATIW